MRSQPGPVPARTRRPAHALVVAVATLLAVVVLAACGDDDDTSVAADRDAGGDAGGGIAPGQVHVRLEETTGVFIEGFEVGLRFETGAGEVIAATLWSDFVASTGRGDLDAYDDSVLTQEVPAGAVRIAAEVNIGMGPGPSIPDLDGPLPCHVDVEVPSGGEVTVEVGFSGGDDCLGVVDEPTDGSSGDPSTSTTSTMAPEPEPGADDLAVGTSRYVDVDLECLAFVLGSGTWVLVDGDLSTWQLPGERHEGGTFTIEAPGRGRFVGDAAETKVATFERLPEGADPECRPRPRP